MKCEAARLLLAKEQITAPVMSAAQVAAREHYETCDACKQALASQWSLARRIRRAGQTIVAPADLRPRVVTALAAEQVQPHVVEFPRRRTTKRWLGAAAVVATAASLLFLVVTSSNERALGPHFVRLVESESETDSMIESSNFAELGQWLESRVGYRVQVPAITNATLTGARVANIGALRTAVISYELPGGTLTYFALPATDGGAIPQEQVETLAADGYHVATWTEYGAQRAVVAMLPRDQLQAIAEECKHMALNPAIL